MRGAETDGPAPALLPLLRALGDLKRSYAAGRQGSIAERLFGAAWSALAAGEDAAIVARHLVTDALVATRLGDLDAGVLGTVGVPAGAIASIRDDAFADACQGLDPGVRDWLAGPLPTMHAAAPPRFVAQLAAQPRAGATCPGRGRLVLEPAENHAEHCSIVAVIGVLLAPGWGARPESVCLAALAHHLHNATLPDAGFAGEVLLGDWLQPAMASATAIALATLSPDLRAATIEACRTLPDATTPEGRAFHAADTLDRVLQVEHHLRAASTTLDFALRDMQLVHAGPVQPFQLAVLARFGFAG